MIQRISKQAKNKVNNDETLEDLVINYKGDSLFGCQVGNHKVLIDVAESMGGKDRADQPPQLFFVSPAPCVGALVLD